jgi:hypothetical protein
MKSLLLCSILAIAASMAKAGQGLESANGIMKADISGTVISTINKKGLKDVNVTVYTTRKEKVIATDCNGNFSFDDLKPGTYKVVFEKNGYKKVVKDKVVIKGDDGLQLNVEMIEEGDFIFVPGVLNMSSFN